MLHVTVVLKVGVTLGLTLGRAQDTKTDQEERAQSETKSRPHRTGEGSKNPAVLGDEEWETGLPSRASLAAAGDPGDAGAFQPYSVVHLLSAPLLLAFPEPGSPAWRW